MGGIIHGKLEIVKPDDMENKEIARLLFETADLMEIAAEDGFRIRSYRNGATAVEGHPERIEDILNDTARKVTDIPGIGKGLAAVLQEICVRGSCERRDLLLAKFPPAAGAVLERFTAWPKVGEVLARGENKASATIGRDGLQVDVRALPRESFGAALQYFTGSKDHNIVIRQRALKLGLTLNEYGLFR